MLTVLDLAQEDTQLIKESRYSYMGQCPGCGGRNRFVVKWLADDKKWVFFCRGCFDPKSNYPDSDRKRGYGREIAYLRHFRNMTSVEAQVFLHGSSDVASSSPEPLADNGRRDYTSSQWQAAIAKEILLCEARLWFPDDISGVIALNYARSRGLEDDIIKGAHMAFSDKGGIPRLIIPSYNNGRYTAIYRRDLRPDCPHDERWRDAPGGTKSELYLADCLRVKRPTVLVEAPIDALSLVQTCGNMVNVVATGGTGNARTIQVLARLARMPIVLVAFDAETGKNKGDESAAWWIERLSNARRLRPVLHDVNDMLMDGWDIRAWVGRALQEYEETTQPAPVIVPVEPEPQVQAVVVACEPESAAPDDFLVCVACKTRDVDLPDAEAMLFFFDEHEDVFCSVSCQAAHQENPTHILSKEEIVENFRAISGFTLQEVIPIAEHEAMKARVEAQYREVILEKQQIVEQHPAFWDQVERDLERRFPKYEWAPSEEQLARASVIRNYPEPFPKYGYITLRDGSRQFGVIGTHAAIAPERTRLHLVK